MAAEERRKRKSKKATAEGVVGGSIAQNGKKRRAALKTTEVVDSVSGKVTETNRSIAAPTLSTKDVIADKRYCRIRAYLIDRKLAILKAEAYRNSVRKPNWKPVRRKPKQVVSSTQCPDCDGSGYAKKGECPRCDGNGWITSP